MVLVWSRVESCGLALPSPLLSAFLIGLACCGPFLSSPPFILSLGPPGRVWDCHSVSLSLCHPLFLVSCFLLLPVRDPLSHTVRHCGELLVIVAWLWPDCGLLCLCAAALRQTLYAPARWKTKCDVKWEMRNEKCPMALPRTATPRL